MAAAHIFDDALDYEVWARVTKSTLTVKGLWDVVETGVPPDPSKNPESAATIQAEELSRWRDLAAKDMEALQVLRSSLKDSSTLSASSAKDVWDSIGKSSLGKQFEEISMREAENLGLYIDRVTDIVEQLRGFNIVKSDYEVITKVLNSVSRQYKTVGPILEEHMDPKTMTLESLADFFDIYDSVVDEPVHRMLRECYNIPLAGRGVYQCGEGGQERENLRNKIKERLQVATEAQEEEIELDYLMLTEEAFGKFKFDDDMWMIYAKSTTNHMTPHEKYFTTLDKTHKAKVRLVDGKFMKVEGKGDVKIMMKEGKKKTIKNVLFVPELNRNVLSLDQMIARDWSVETKPDRCIFLDRTGAEFGDSVWEDERGPALRLQVIESNQQQQVASEAQIDEEEEIVVDYVMAAPMIKGSVNYDEDMWMVSGFATIHMTPYEKFFTALDRTHKGKVGLVDGKVIMVEGKGDVKIVMKEGKTKTISNVLFVPEIKRNVLSLSQMKSIGCSFREGGRGECIISDRSGAVFGETMWVDKDLALRLEVIKGNLTS